jgi:tetratricopeptide (TPR) repeat protein
MMARMRNAFFVAIFAVGWMSCITVQYNADISDYHRQIAELEAQLTRKPNDAGALRDLGAIYFEVKQYPRAETLLKKSYDLDEKDAKTQFYYGMTLEFENKLQSALAIYINYSDFSSLSPYRKLMEGRYHSITLDIIHLQLQELLAKEASLTNNAVPTTSVAVFPLDFEGGNERFTPLGKGLSEMMTIDLGQVKNLNLIERVRVEALLDELKLSQSKLFDPATAPRFGKLLSAGRIVAGSYSVSKEDQLTLNVASWDVVKKQYPKTVSQSDALANLFRLEKDLVFDVIKKLGIKLTAAERTAIQRIPTRNIQAFLMYSIGLDREDAHDFDAAKVYYEQATSLDPGFDQAKTKTEAMGAMVVAGGDKGKALTYAQSVDPLPTPDANVGQTDLMTNRLESLGNGIGSGFYPGQDDRKPAQEAAAAGELGGTLPPPPRPPGK